MPDITVLSAEDIKTPEQGRQAVAELHRAVTDLRTRNGSLEAKIEEMGRDYHAITQKMAESEARASKDVAYTPEERGLLQYIRQDGSITLGIDVDHNTADILLQGGKRSVTGHDAQRDDASGLLTGDRIHGEWHRQLLDLVQLRSLVRVHTQDRHGRMTSPKVDRMIARHMQTAPKAIQRIFTDSSGQGAEWIPDVTLPLLWETAKAERRLEAAFLDVPMSDKTVVIPYLSRGLRPYKKGVPTTNTPGAYTASELSTASRTKTAVGLAVRYLVDEDSSEDSIIDNRSLIERELVSAIVDGTEDAILNGDTTASHQDVIASWDTAGRWGTTGLGAPDDHRRSWMGLRKICLAITAGGSATASADKSATQTFDGVVACRAGLSAPLGVNPADCIVVTSWAWYAKYMLGFDEIQTMEKYGPNATVVTGEVARLGGMPVVLSQFMGSTATDGLNASGLFDNSVLSYTGLVVVNTRRFAMMNRRGITVERAKDIGSGVFEYVATARKLFTGLDYDDAGWATASRVPAFYAFKLTA